MASRSLHTRRVLVGLGVPVALVLASGALLAPKTLTLARQIHARMQLNDLEQHPRQPGPDADPGPPGTPAQRAAARSWLSAGGQRHLETIVDALSGFAKLNSDDNKAVRALCAHLTVDVDQARGYRAFPDGRGQAAWSAMLSHLHTGGVECERAVDHDDAVAELRAVRAIDASGDDIARFLAREHELTTDTTTERVSYLPRR
jgi:hypothetical protein